MRNAQSSRERLQVAACASLLALGAAVAGAVEAAAPAEAGSTASAGRASTVGSDVQFRAAKPMRAFALGAGRVRAVRVLGTRGIPAFGVSSVTARVTARSTGVGSLVVRPGGKGRRASFRARIRPGRRLDRVFSLAPGRGGKWDLRWAGHGSLRLRLRLLGYETDTPEGDPGGGSPGGDPGGGPQPAGGSRFDIGTPTLTDLWVDPARGDDGRDGSSRSRAVRTLAEAWSRIPSSTNLATGVRVQLVSGTYPPATLPGYMEHRWGQYSAPIIFNAADGAGTARLGGDLNVFDTRYLYLVGVSIEVAGDAFHCERCSYVLLRDSALNGLGQAHETIKVNQSDHIMIEDSTIEGAYENAIDFVAVQHGHIRGNRIRDADDWCAYVKGGSAYLTVAENEIYRCGTGGFSAGQGTGFEFMASPWLHYEAMDVKVFNNVVHDTWGAGLGVNGGYNILLAYNTLYRVGDRSHAVEFVFGARGCDGDTGACAARNALGGWGSTAPGGDGWIPNRHVYFYNNVIHNPMPFRSAWSQFAVYGPRAVPSGTNLVGPARADEDLRIVGNLIWNGPGTGLDLGVGPGAGCEDTNPTCSAGQLARDNSINSAEPAMRDPGAGDYRPLADGVIAGARGSAIPEFGWAEMPGPPTAPSGSTSNAVPRNRAGDSRDGWGHPGAY